MAIKLTDRDIVCLEYLPEDMWPEHIKGMQPIDIGSPRELIEIRLELSLLKIENRERIAQLRQVERLRK